jgi:hypothetical protein
MMVSLVVKDSVNREVLCSVWRVPSPWAQTQ